MPYLTESLRIEILQMLGYGDRSRTQAEVAQLFAEVHPELTPISQSTVSKIERRYRTMGHVRDVPRERPPKIDEETRLNVLLQIEEHPVTPARQLARLHQVSHTSVLKLFKEVKMHPYKMQSVQELNEEDFDRRLEFCEQMMGLIDGGQIFTEWILFSDEATFTLHGHVNRQNCRYWSNENPHWMRECHTQHPQKTNVWAGIIGGRIVGPVFFNQNLTAELYLDMLQNLVPALAALFPNEVDPAIMDERIWFQQDGAPPHFALIVRNYLDQMFPNRWIGRRGPIEWPARSPDLTPLDFFLWGYLKSKVYLTKPNDIEDLQNRIREEIRQITPQVLENVQNGFYHRLGHCQQQVGGHFEHLLH